MASSFDDNTGLRVFHHPAYRILLCPACGLHYKSQTLPLDQLGEYYAQLPCETYDVGDDFPTERIVRKWLASLPNGSRVLDYGCSTGRLLRHVAARLSCHGVEVNATASAKAASKGIHIVTDADLPASPRFEAIVLSDVYEHLAQPLTLTAQLASLLSPGGMLVIVTGNADAVHPDPRLGEFWYFRSVGHLQMAGERHLAWLARQLDLQLEAVHRCSHYSMPLLPKVRQWVQRHAYEVFADQPESWVATILRRIPRIRNAERWASAPACEYGADHIVALLRRPPEPMTAERNP